MTFLEKKIIENPNFFDDQIPPLGHKNRFIEKLDNKQEDDPVVKKWWAFTRIAAVIVLFISVSVVLFRYSFSDLSGAVIKEATRISFSEEIEEVFAYYDALSTANIKKIDQLALNEQEAQRVKAIAGKQLENLDANLAAIEKEYAKNPDNQMLKAAMVNNKRMKAEIVDNIVKQLNEAGDTFKEQSLLKQ